MFKNLFGNKGSSSKTGFFQVFNETLIEINEVPGNGSINACIESLGFPKNHLRIVHTFNSDKFDCLGFKTLSKEVILVFTKKPEMKITYTDVRKEISKIDWGFEYSSLNVEDILEEGVELENFDLKFLKSVLDLREDGDNIYRSDRLGLYFQFDNDILKAFTSTGFKNSSTKWLNELNQTMIRRMTEDAQQYHQNEIDIMEEVNKQTQSLLGIPHAMNNEFIPLHTRKNGNVHFYNLLVTHYNRVCNLDEFLFMNRGRFKKIKENTIEVGNFIYSFNTLGQLENRLEK